ncbi:MAG: type II/IV secretion system protein [Gemmatimonadetes bacterium]|nr:type II/IV secretion system protein [Gemmatimonadota bacterium]
MAVTTTRDEWLIPTLAKLMDASQLELVRAGDESYWSAAVTAGYTTDASILSELSARFRMGLADLATSSAAARSAVSEALARKYQVVPLSLSDAALEVAIANPNDFDCERALGFATGKPVRFLLASPTEIAAQLDALYRPEETIDAILDASMTGDALETIVDDIADESSFELGAEKASARPIIRLVDHIIAEGIGLRASDIHLEAQESGVQVTYRIDGVLRPAMKIPRAAGIPLVSRIKIMSGLDIADRLRPQDGRARVAIDGRRIDLRVSTLPASTGEKVVIRILDSNATVLDLQALGIRPTDLDRVNQLINLREGIILVTGPTGSGKTTTLYSALRTIQERGVNIVTVEDPVEYKLNGIVQVQVNEKAGLSFAAALRSILRQDPDVVLVGEIRDRETAGIAIQASLTGHLVLSTLHTIDAASSVARLLDIGIESYKIGAALKGVVAQRLVRRLCLSCREPVSEDVPVRFSRWIPTGALTFAARGCAECGGTGYRGRLALMEVLVVTADVERRISSGETAERIVEAARQGGMASLWDSGIEHVLEGNTDLQELLRVVEVPVPRDTVRPERSGVRTPITHESVASRRPSGVQPAVARSDLTGGAFELALDMLPAAPTAALPRALLAIADAAERASMREALEKVDFVVVEAADGITALEEVDHTAADVVVVDLALPKLDGMGVLKRLRTRLQTASLPVVLLSDGENESMEVRAFEAGANDFVVRPVRTASLSAKLKSLVKKK